MVLLLMTFGYMTGICILSLVPDTGDPSSFLAMLPPEVQNFLHIPGYGLMAVLLALILRISGVTGFRCFWFALALTIGYGIFIEVCQIWVPGREVSMEDLIFDVVGGILFLEMYRQLERRVLLDKLDV